MEGPFALKKAVAVYAAKFGLGAIPRPPYWSGFRVTPLEMEFWHDRPFRLHDRIAFRRSSAGEPWVRSRLYP
jgi:pyridoxamine 5'-phosphate oxidase